MYAITNNTDFPVLTAIEDPASFIASYYRGEIGNMYHEQWYFLDGYQEGDEEMPWLNWKEVDMPIGDRERNAAHPDGYDYSQIKGE